MSSRKDGLGTAQKSGAFPLTGAWNEKEILGAWNLSASQFYLSLVIQTSCCWVLELRSSCGSDVGIWAGLAAKVHTVTQTFLTRLSAGGDPCTPLSPPTSPGDQCDGEGDSDQTELDEKPWLLECSSQKERALTFHGKREKRQQEWSIVPSLLQIQIVKCSATSCSTLN